MRSKGCVIDEVLRVTGELLALAEAGESEATDDSCRILYGVVRDSAHKIRALAEKELRAHADRGSRRESFER